MKERPNSLAQIVGQAIFQRRRALGMSQEELAERVGIGQQSLSRMEQGKTGSSTRDVEISFLDSPS